MLFFVIPFFLSCYPSDNPCVWLILLEYSTLVLLPPNFSAGHHTLTLSWPCWNAFFHNLFFNHSMTLATTLLWVLQWASSDWHLTISLSFLIYSFDVDLALWLLGMGEMIFAQESTLPSSPPPVASIQNKANSPFHQPGLFTGFWAASISRFLVMLRSLKKQGSWVYSIIYFAFILNYRLLFWWVSST